MENKYFTPDMEDFHIGYECEISTPTIWKSGKFPEILELNSELDEFGKDSLMKAAHAILRVPYLTKEQIETEGWKENVLNNNEKALLLFLKNGYELRMYKNYICRFSILIVGAGIIPNWDKVLFEGKCKDINTFRKICKLLEI